MVNDYVPCVFLKQVVNRHMSTTISKAMCYLSCNVARVQSLRMLSKLNILRSCRTQSTASSANISPANIDEQDEFILLVQYSIVLFLRYLLSKSIYLLLISPFFSHSFQVSPHAVLPSLSRSSLPPIPHFTLSNGTFFASKAPPKTVPLQP